MATAAAVMVGPDLAILLSRMNFVAEAKPGQKLIFGKHQLSYVDAKDVLRNKLLRHWWNWQDATTNAHDVMLTVQQGAVFLATAPVDHQHYSLVVERMTLMKDGIYHLVNTHVENHEFRANLSIALVDIDTAVAMAIGRRRIAATTAAAAVPSAAAVPPPPPPPQSLLPDDPALRPLAANAVASPAAPSSST